MLRMCIRGNKPTLACAGMMFALMYLSATNLEHPIRVINGNERGNNLKDLSDIKNVEELNENDYILNSITGDMYNFSKQNNR